MNTNRELFDIFYEDVEPFTGASNEEINKVEKELNYKLPQIFRDLLISRNGGVPKVEGVAIPDWNVEDVDQIFGTGQLLGWNDGSGFEMPKGVIRFGITGHVCWCFDYNKLNEKQEPKIARFDEELDEASEEPWIIFQSFREFLEAFQDYPEDEE